MWAAIGLASLVVAASIAYLCVRLGRTLGRVDDTLVKVDRQLDGAEAPLLKTLGHVGGVADSVDALVAKVNRIANVAEHAAETVAKTADAAQAAVTPAVANLAGIVAGVSQGAKTFFRSRGRNGAWPDD
jgi:uncharacterized protein YoxC